MSVLESIWDRITREPVLMTTLVGAVISLLVVFGVPITDDQKAAIVVVVAAVLALFARSQVTPVASPELDKGTVVRVITPKGVPNSSAVL